MGPWQGFCARYCFLRVHFCVYLVKGPNKLAVLSCLGTDGLFILLSWTHSWAWEAAAPGHTLEVLAQKSPSNRGSVWQQAPGLGVCGRFWSLGASGTHPRPLPPTGLQEEMGLLHS